MSGEPFFELCCLTSFLRNFGCLNLVCLWNEGFFCVTVLCERFRRLKRGCAPLFESGMATVRRLVFLTFVACVEERDELCLVGLFLFFPVTDVGVIVDTEPRRLRFKS